MPVVGPVGPETAEVLLSKQLILYVRVQKQKA